MVRPVLLWGVVLFGLTGCASNSHERVPANDDCAPIDLREPGQSMAGLPAGEQGDGYTCGFFAAASVVDAYRQSYLDERISPDGPFPSDPLALAVDLAVQKNRPIWLPIQLTSDPLTTVPGRHGSIACDILRNIRENGACRNDDPRVFDKEAMTKASNQATELYMVLYRFGRTSRKKADLRATTEQVFKIIPELRLSQKEVETVLQENRRKPYRSVQALLFPRCSQRRITAKELDFPRCRTRIFAGADLLGLRGNAGDPLRSKRARKWIDRLFDRPKPQPILATHCHRVYQEGRAFRGSSPFSKKCILHHVNIVGRRKKNGVCQYLTQNSYDPKDQDAVSSDWERDGGFFWIDSIPFERSLYSLQFFDRRDVHEADFPEDATVDEPLAEAQLAEWEREFSSTP